MRDTDAPDQLASALGDVLARVTPSAGHVTGLHRLGAGASRETWAFDAGTRRLILRRDRASTPDAAAMAREASCLRAAAAAGVPVPEVVSAGDGTDAVGRPYLVLERLDGETLPQKLLRDERWAGVRPRLAHQLGAALAQIHAIDLDAVPGLERRAHRVADLRGILDGFGEPRPAVELVLRWLHEHRPAPVAPALVHGDFRNGNVMIDGDGLRAVLDWELAHVGDPREDLGWVCAKAWRFGSALPVGGFGTRAELFDGYEQVSGVRPDPASVRWWEVYACVHWALICRLQAERHLSGREQSVEMAVLGRRGAEAEFDALLALGLAEARADAAEPGPLPAAEAVAHARPTTDELLAAVVGYLRSEHRPGDAHDAYLAKVAANAVTIARRSLRADAYRDDYTAALAALGCADDAALARLVRSADAPATDPEVVAAVRAGLVAQLAVTNPRHLTVPDC